MADELPTGVERFRSGYRVRKRMPRGRVQRSFRTLATAMAFLAELEGADAVPSRAASPFSVMAIVDRWFSDPRSGRRHRLRPGAERSYDEHIKRHIARIGDERAEDYARNPRLLRAFYDSLPPVAALRVHTILKQAFEDALDHGEITRNPCSKVRPNRRAIAQPERDIPTPHEVALMVAAAREEDPVWGLFVSLIATLGLRRSEACALRWEDIDFEKRTVRVGSAVELGLGPQSIGPTKSGRARVLHAGVALFDELEPFRKEGGYLFTGYYRAGVRSEQSAKCWHPSSASHRFLRMVRGLGLIGESGRPYALHSLRHFVATQLLVAGKPITQVSRFLGHKKPSITQDLYGNHAVQDAYRDVGETATQLFRRESPLNRKRR